MENCEGDIVKGFKRENQLLSLCGLNCGLCPMLLGNYCGGCGNGNQSCKLARCSMEQKNIEYCFQCRDYPCGKYEHFDDYDSFITHQSRRTDFEKARQYGLEAYNAEQTEKVRILNTFLNEYSDGRKKNFFCVAVNLLELQELQKVLEQTRNKSGIEMLPPKEKSAFVTKLLQDVAAKNKISLKLHKKK
nr:DUF3795 domain-containing protein [Enterocloster clostridioformis]